MKKAIITIAILFLMVFSLASNLMAEDSNKLVAKSDVWSILQGKWTNEYGGELTINGREIECVNPLLEPPKDINSPMSNKIIAYVGIRGTIDITSKDEFDTIWVGVSGKMIIGDSKGKPKKEINNYNDKQFFWIKFPEPNNQYGIVMSSDHGMNAIEPGFDTHKVVAKNDVWSVLQGKWVNEDGGEAVINGHEIEYINVLIAPPKDINDPEEKRVISGAIAVKGTLTSYLDKNNKDTIFFKVTGSMILFDDQGNPTKEVKNYKNDMFFWIQYPDKNEYTIVPCGSDNGMEPCLIKEKK